MSMRINLNTTALTAQRMLSQTDSKLSKSIERLSSGYRINSAADDPAGLVISEKLSAQVGGLNQAIANAGDAINMVKTAEGALTEVSSLLSSMRDLAVAAANTGASDEESVAADQQQIINAINSINNIANETQFGNKNLLDGSAGVKSSITGTAVDGANLNNGGLNLSSTDSLSIRITQAAEQATLGTKAFGSSTTAIGADGNIELTGGNGTTVIIDYTSDMTVSDFADAINAQSDDTGVTATVDTTTGTITFTSDEYGSNTTISIADSEGNILAGGLTSDSDSGVDVEAVVTNSAGELVSDVTWDCGSGTVLKDSNGNVIYLTTAAATTDVSGGPVSYDDQFSIVDNSLIFQIGAYAGQTRSISIGTCSASGLGLGASSLFTSLADIDVTTSEGAQEAIKVLDQAISDVSTLRANLGATQTNVLESSSNSLTVAEENIAASESTIKDTDMASEISNMTQLQILEQAGVSMLSQANQIPQNILKLLQ
ncbi:hypothetical protein LLG46_07380 [bacterium]|nr:hypothetical protein [bacterium]